MVLDVRHLNKEKKVSLGKPLAASGIVELPLEIGASPVTEDTGFVVGLEALIDRATSAVLAERLGAVEELRQLVPNQNGIDLLWQIVGTGDQRRRLVAAQLLAYHSHRLNATSTQKKLIDRLDIEQDPQILQALVRAVGPHHCVQHFLLAHNEGLAKETALAIPLNRKTLETIVQALHCGHEEVARILLDRLDKLPEILVEDFCLYLLHLDWSTALDQLKALLIRLPQIQLFMLFVEHKGMPQWADKAEQQLRQVNLVEQTVRQLLHVQPSKALVRYLLQRSSEDAIFARRHALLIREHLNQPEANAAELLEQLADLTEGASNDKLVHLAQVLVELTTRLKGNAADQAVALLEDLKNRSPDLKLKIYHLQQGWA